MIVCHTAQRGRRSAVLTLFYCIISVTRSFFELLHISLEFYICVPVASRMRCDEIDWRGMLDWDIYVCRGESLLVPVPG